MSKYSSPKKLAYQGVAVTPSPWSCPSGSFISSLRASGQLLPARSPAPLSLGFAQQQHLLSQLPELGDQAVSFASAGQVAHAPVSIGRFQVAVEHEFDSVQVFGSTHQERAADAESARGAADAETRVAAMAKRHGMQAPIALEDLARPFVGLVHEPVDALGLSFRLDHAHR